jgi:hypothetical protein
MYFSNGPFDDDVSELIRDVFSAVCREHQVALSDELAREDIALSLIRLASAGERNFAALKAQASAAYLAQLCRARGLDGQDLVQSASVAGSR